MWAMTIRLIDHELASTKAAFLVALSLRTSWGHWHCQSDRRVRASNDAGGVRRCVSWGIKKVPETSPPRTQQHLVTCSGRGQHNAALATCCCCVSIDTKLSCYSDLRQFRRQLLALPISLIKAYSGRSIQKIVVFSYPIKCCRS